MVVNFKVFKKSSPNSKVTVYMGKRDFVDHVTSTEQVEGVVVLDDEYIRDKRKIWGQLVCSFRYGREEDEVMGLNFQKELYLASEQVFPPERSDSERSKMQERLIKKLGSNAYPFTFNIPQTSPASITLQQAKNDNGEPCGVQYFVKVFAGDSETDRTHRRSTVMLAIRKVQYAPSKQGNQPCTLVRKDFMMSPGELELEVTLDKQLYHHGEKIAVNLTIRNHSNKTVKKIKGMVQQGVDVVLFQNGQYRNTISNIETDEGCPLGPGQVLTKVLFLTPALSSVKDKQGIALDGKLKNQDTNLASTTL